MRKNLEKLDPELPPSCTLAFSTCVRTTQTFYIALTHKR